MEAEGGHGTGLTRGPEMQKLQKASTALLLGLGLGKAAYQFVDACNWLVILSVGAR